MGSRAVRGAGSGAATVAFRIGAERERTVPTAAHVGLTPGDVYWLFVDPESKRIERWEMKPEGQEEPPQGTSWTDYREVAGLWLVHDHASDDGSRPCASRARAPST